MKKLILHNKLYQRYNYTCNNLDYKIVCGNSLPGYPYKPRWTKEIEVLKKDFFETTGLKRKQELKKQIDSKIKGFLATSEKSLGY